MKRNNKTLAKIKRGFTLVELVIVIAVIAILAAVLIPTFITVIDSANDSADVQLVANMNAVLATDFDADSTATAENLRKLMKDNGIDNFETKKSDNVILYDKSAKKFVLMSDFEKKVKAVSLSAAGKTGAAKNLAAKPLAEEGGLTLDENAYSPEEIFDGYIITSTGGNDFVEALYYLHNLPNDGKLHEQPIRKGSSRERVINIFNSITNSDVKNALITTVNSALYIAADGTALKFWMQQSGAIYMTGTAKTRVVFNEEIKELDLEKLSEAVGSQAIPVILPQTIESIKLPDTDMDFGGMMLLGNTSAITAEQKDYLSNNGVQISETALSEIREELVEMGPLLARDKFYFGEKADSDQGKYNNLQAALDDAGLSAKYSGLNRTVIMTANGTIENGTTLTVPQGVTLLLPYGTDETSINSNFKYGGTNTAGQIITENVSTFNDNSKKSVELTVNATIINRGTITVGGETTGQQGGQAGCTAGRYAQITLGANAKIESYGDINSYGFIVEAAENNGSQVIMHSGAMKLPFIVVEHRGGTQFMDMVELEEGETIQHDKTYTKFAATPFNRFYMENVRPKLTVEYGAQVVGYAKLNAKADNIANIKLVGTANDCLIQLEASSKLIAKYNSSKVTDLEIKGNATMHSLTMPVVITTVSTEEAFFPLSWYWNVTLSPFENGTAATVDTTAQKIKLLPGAKFTVSKDVTLKASEIVVYDENAISDIIDPANGGKTPYEKKEQAAILTVNGTLEANALGGKVLTTQDGAKLIVKNVSITTSELTKNAEASDELTGTKPSEYKEITTKLKNSDNQELAAGTYVAKDGKWGSANA